MTVDAPGGEEPAVSDPTPPPGDPLPSREACQVHAVLCWLVAEADVPNDVHLHLLVDALLAWAPLMCDHLFPTASTSGF